jgi:hypothetical protein
MNHVTHRFEGELLDFDVRWVGRYDRDGVDFYVDMYIGDGETLATLRSKSWVHRKRRRGEQRTACDVLRPLLGEDVEVAWDPSDGYVLCAPYTPPDGWESVELR